MSVDDNKLTQVLESLILAYGQPISIETMLQVFTEEDKPTKTELKSLLDDLIIARKGTVLEIKEVASGYRAQINQEYAPWIVKLWDEKAPRYSRALLETLVLVAYRQPITRAEVEEIRGVSVSTGIIKTLTEREWVRVVGHRDVPGKPALYATTKKFLDYFNLSSLEELPTLEAIMNLDEVDEKLEAQLELNIQEALLNPLEPEAQNEEVLSEEVGETPEEIALSALGFEDEDEEVFSKEENEILQETNLSPLSIEGEETISEEEEETLQEIDLSALGLEEENDEEVFSESFMEEELAEEER